MMKRLKKNLAFLLAVVLCLNLVACGGSDKPATEDWRNSGVVVDSGTITHEGEGSVHVLVTVDENRAAFYRDEPEQSLFDSVSFPMTISNAQACFDAISFDDINGDGESDVRLAFVCAPDDITSLVWIWDPAEHYVFRGDLSVLPTGGDISEYVGLWEYADENLWLRIYDDGTWDFFNDQEDVIQSGTLWVDETGIQLFFAGTGDVMQLDCSGSDCLTDTVNGGMLIPADSIQPRVPYFTRYGLEINAEMDKGTYWLKNGVCSYSSNGTGYRTGDCYWEAVKNYDYTHDGIREIQFDAICYIPQSSIGSSQELQIGTTCGLCDFHTGAWLPASENHGNSGRGENNYQYTFDWNGESVTVEFAFSSDWQFYVGEWIGVLTMSYVVYMTEGYDGLVFVAEPEPINYSDFENKMQLGTAGATIMDVEALDPYGCLFFSVCGLANG